MAEPDGEESRRRRRETVQSSRSSSGHVASNAASIQAGWAALAPRCDHASDRIGNPRDRFLVFCRLARGTWDGSWGKLAWVVPYGAWQPLVVCPQS